MNDLVERYLHAIEFWLPKAQRSDLIAEISENLHAQIEDKRAALGRALTGDEVETLLSERGRPMLVANNYRAQRSLIGPALFPTYLFVLKLVGLVYLVPWFTVFLIVRRVQQPTSSWSTTIVATSESLWSVGFVVAGVITVIFAALEGYEHRTKAIERWSPRDLPAVRNARRIPISGSIAELVAHLVFLFWWIRYFSSPVVFHGGSLRVSLTPVREYFFWGFVSIAVLKIGLATCNLFRPYWTRLRATFLLLSDLTGVTLFCWLMRSYVLRGITIGNVDPARTLLIENAIRGWMLQIFPAAVIVAVVIIAFDVARIVRVHGAVGLFGVNAVPRLRSE